jgi:hypothetical protein
MQKKRKHHFISKQIAVCTILIVASASVTSFTQLGYNITVKTDLPLYFSGEEVNISGRLTENGNGIQGEICINVTDPDSVELFGLCTSTDSQGYYYYIYSLDPDAMLGVYTANVKDNEDHGAEASTTFEVTAPIICGDTNTDTIINVGDVVFLITYLYRGGSEPDPVCKGDVNKDGIVNVGDVVYLITYLYRGGSEPDPDCCNE